eukprot:6151270-Alexandrium_andersonii.AAC.1
MSASLVGSEMCIRDSPPAGGRGEAGPRSLPLGPRPAALGGPDPAGGAVPPTQGGGVAERGAGQ